MFTAVLDKFSEKGAKRKNWHEEERENKLPNLMSLVLGTWIAEVAEAAVVPLQI